MATTLLAVAMLVLWAAPALGTTYDLPEVMAGEVEGLDVSVMGNGAYYGDSIDTTFDNRTSETFDVEVPIGTSLAPADEGVQTMLTAGGERIEVPPGQTSTTIKAFCGEQHDSAPGSSDTFSFDGYETGDTLNTLRAANDAGIYDSDAGAAVWFHTDGLDVSANEIAVRLVEGYRVPAGDAAAGGIAAVGITSLIALLSSAAASGASTITSATGSAAAGLTSAGAPPAPPPTDYSEIGELGTQAHDPTGGKAEVRGGVLEHLDSGGATSSEQDPYAPVEEPPADEASAQADDASDKPKTVLEHLDSGEATHPDDRGVTFKPQPEPPTPPEYMTANDYWDQLVDNYLLKIGGSRDAAHAMGLSDHDMRKSVSEALKDGGLDLPDPTDPMQSGPTPPESEYKLDDTGLIYDTNMEPEDAGGVLDGSQKGGTRTIDDDGNIVEARQTTPKTKDAFGKDVDLRTPDQKSTDAADDDLERELYSDKKPQEKPETTATSKVGKDTAASQQRAGAKQGLTYDPEKNAYRLQVGNTWVKKGENGWTVWQGDEMTDPFKQSVPDFEVQEGPFSVEHGQGTYKLVGGHEQGRQTGVSFTPGKDGFTASTGDANDRTIFSKIKDAYSLDRQFGPEDKPSRTMSASFDSESKDFSVFGSDGRGGVGLSREGDTWQADWITGSGDDKFSRALSLNTKTKEGMLDVGGYQLYNTEDTFGFSTGSEGFTIEEGFSGGTLTTRHHGSYPVTLGAGDDSRFTLFGSTPGSIKGKPMDIEFMANKGMRVSADENMGPVITPAGEAPKSEFWLGLKDPKTGISVRQGVIDGKPESWVGFKKDVRF